jgi:hypothetical protein
MKQKKKKINKNKPIAFIAIGLFVFLIIWFNPFKKVKEERILVDGKIEYVRCQIGTKGSRSLIKVRYKSKLYNLPITKSKCKELDEGDSISVIYIKNKDKILIE